MPEDMVMGMTRSECIREAQKAEELYAQTGEAKYKLAAMTYRDALAATAPQREYEPVDYDYAGEYEGDDSDMEGW